MLLLYTITDKEQFTQFDEDGYIKEKCKTVDSAILMLPPSNFKNYAATIQSITKIDQPC